MTGPTFEDPTRERVGRRKCDDHQMLIRATKAVLASMLEEAGVGSRAIITANVRATVETFRQFAMLPTEDAAPLEEDGDAVLAEFGTYGFRGGREFSAGLTRQFAEVGDEGAMWQVGCTFYWAPQAATDILASGHLWSFGRALDDFFDELGDLPGWAWALGGGQAPSELVIALDRI
ncbi:hypothetical protein Aca07nite_68640 [Actinoplanes capillaceus]|uniref:Uncharacterized protein n=1 Tax=Actinoplanes campanulatus TaxID=113559 RepID=A0ABQ3WTS2_9ACTN|nr:hypothetical protein [Actinoplanes capillaceus]GID49589.1 hypothetical protein Aca07nite_68640 [Actinoplanes capillaceus]